MFLLGPRRCPSGSGGPGRTPRIPAEAFPRDLAGAAPGGRRVCALSTAARSGRPAETRPHPGSREPGAGAADRFSDAGLRVIQILRIPSYTPLCASLPLPRPTWSPLPSAVHRASVWSTPCPAPTVAPYCPGRLWPWQHLPLRTFPQPPPVHPRGPAHREGVAPLPPPPLHLQGSLRKPGLPPLTPTRASFGFRSPLRLSHTPGTGCHGCAGQSPTPVPNLHTQGTTEAPPTSRLTPSQVPTPAVPPTAPLAPGLFTALSRQGHKM